MGRFLVHKYPLGSQLARGLLGCLGDFRQKQNRAVCAKADNILLDSGPGRYKWYQSGPRTTTTWRADIMGQVCTADGEPESLDAAS